MHLEFNLSYVLYGSCIGILEQPKVFTGLLCRSLLKFESYFSWTSESAKITEFGLLLLFSSVFFHTIFFFVSVCRAIRCWSLKLSKYLSFSFTLLAEERKMLIVPLWRFLEQKAELARLRGIFTSLNCRQVGMRTRTVDYFY